MYQLYHHHTHTTHYRKLNYPLERYKAKKDVCCCSAQLAHRLVLITALPPLLPFIITPQKTNALDICILVLPLKRCNLTTHT